MGPGVQGAAPDPEGMTYRGPGAADCAHSQGPQLYRVMELDLPPARPGLCVGSAGPGHWVPEGQMGTLGQQQPPSSLGKPPTYRVYHGMHTHWGNGQWPVAKVLATCPQAQPPRHPHPAALHPGRRHTNKHNNVNSMGKRIVYCWWMQWVVEWLCCLGGRGKGGLFLGREWEVGVYFCEGNKMFFRELSTVNMVLVADSGAGVHG